jgi:class 3 adenylate cyclase
VFDVSGFTNSFNKPDIQDYITDYINQIIDCVELCIWAGEAFWIEEGNDARELDSMVIKPAMRKFLSDGMLYVWEDDEEKSLSKDDVKINLLNALWNIQIRMGKINSKIRDYMPVADLPKAIKFGLAQGSIYKLTENDGSIDYIGPCINLASRLVKYCPDLNFIASSRLKIDKKFIKKYGYIKVVAKALRSFDEEIVIVEKSDYEGLDSNERERLFEDL